MTSTDTGFTRTPAGARPFAPHLLLCQGADGSVHQAEAPGTGLSRNLRHQIHTGSAERMDLCREPGPPTPSRSPVLFFSPAPRPTPASPWQAPRPVWMPDTPPPSLGTFPVLAGCHPHPRAGLYEARKVFFCGVGSIFKKRFSCFSEGAKYSTGINREIDIKPKCPCENHAGCKELFKKT